MTDASRTAATGARPRAPTRRVDVVAVGVSTGGPDALATLLRHLPADVPVPIVIVQHMPPTFTRLLAERLDAELEVHVVEAAGGERLTPGQAWLAPGDFHMTVTRDHRGTGLLLNQDPPENSCRPAIDVLFRSVAQVYGPHVLAIVLTGMGEDGLQGCAAIRRAGGTVLAQDQSSSVVWGMPRRVAEAGLAAEVLPIDAMGATIMRRVEEWRARPRDHEAGEQ